LDALRRFHRFQEGKKPENTKSKCTAKNETPAHQIRVGRGAFQIRVISLRIYASAENPTADVRARPFHAERKIVCVYKKKKKSRLPNFHPLFCH
jgi:hypothetical protein